MMELLRTWLFGLTALSALLAMGESLVSQESIRRVIRLAGGVLMIIVLLQPLSHIDLADLAISAEAYRRQAETAQEEYRQQQQETLTAGIEEELATYIWDKAQQLGVECQVSVTAEAGADGLPLPTGITVTGTYSEELSEIIARDLGIPRENQNWREAE